jgi:hypothetical protein
MSTLRDLRAVLGLLLLFAGSGALSAAPWMGKLVIRDGQVWQGGRDGNYGVVKYFIDEAAGEVIPIEVSVQVYADEAPPSVLQVEVFSNLNRRDFAKVFESPTDAGGASSYYLTYPMTFSGSAGNNHLYKAQLNVSKTGAYRLTTRFRIRDGPWLWHNDFDENGTKQRDCAVVVSPKKVQNLSIYEANPLVVEAGSGGGFGERSSFEDFTDHDQDGYDRFNLDLVRNKLGFDTIWLMPIFPVTQERWDPSQNSVVANHSPGSPYATRNYFAANPALSAANNAAAAMSEFQYLVQKAEDMQLNVLIDVAFNHAGRDVVFGRGAVDLGLVPAAQENDRIRQVRPSWASRGTNYREHGGSPDGVALFAPVDRNGEHNWFDAGIDWFFGDYSCLGPKIGYGDTSRGNAEDERDLLFTDLDPAGGYDFEVENVWNYFARVLGFWLDQTSNQLDGIRADFAQGLPPQAWEYIINRTRQKRWDFVFLAEVLDPDKIRYRVNRHFDLITTVNHYLYRSDNVTTTDLINSLEAEASLYGFNAAVLHNGTSHDEDGNGNVWLMAARYAVAAGSYGVPMVYMSQPLGIAEKIDFQYDWRNIKNAWDSSDPKIFAFYSRVNEQRRKQPAFRSTNRYFLSQKQGGIDDRIFSAARWFGENVVLLFTNLSQTIPAPATFAIPDALPLSTDARYQVVNLLADDPEQPLWPAAKTGAQIRQEGVTVIFTLPNESQWLLLRKQ